MHRPALAAALAAGLALAAAPVRAADAPAAPATADTQPAPDAKALWSKKCASCHGATGDADTKMGKKHEIDDLTKPAWHARHGDDEVRKAIEDGVPDTKMKAFKEKLTAAEITALVAHIRTLAKP